MRIVNILKKKFHPKTGFVLFGLLCFSLSVMGDECGGGVNVPPPPVFELTTQSTANGTKFSFSPGERIFLNSIIVNEYSSGYNKTFDFGYPYPITSAGETKVIYEYRGAAQGKWWQFTFNGQSLVTSYGFRVTDSVYVY